MASRKISRAETVFIDALEAAGLRVLRQHKIGPWVVDAYLPRTRTVIEFNGWYWHSLPAMKARDARKEAWLRAHGYRLSIVAEPKHYQIVDLDRLGSVMAGFYRPQEESGDATEYRSTRPA